MNDVTIDRYANDNGVPVHEEIMWRYMPDDPRSRATPFHAALDLVLSEQQQVGVDEEGDPVYGMVDVPAPNGWFFLGSNVSAGSPLNVIPEIVGGVPSDTSPYWAPYDLPLRAGVAIISVQDYSDMVAAQVAAQAVIASNSRAASLTAAQTTWDATSALLANDGLGTASISALLGPRPT